MNAITKRPNVTRADIPDELFAEWQRRRAEERPASYRSLAIEATRRLGIPVRDDAVARWLDGISGLGRTGRPVRSISSRASGSPAPDMRSEPKPPGHPATWLCLWTNMTSLLDERGQPPAYLGSRRIPYGLAK